MITMYRGTRRLFRTSLAAAVVIGGFAACADKQLLNGRDSLNPVLSLQITTTGLQQASQVAGFAPKFLVLATGYERNSDGGQDDDVGLLAMKYFPITAGTSTATLDVNLAPCLGDTERPGPRDSCELLVGAGLVLDSVATAARDTASIFANAFDLRIIGPFTVAPGRTPVIPAIDLSQSRFGVIDWRGDFSLQLGGGEVPSTASQGSVLGLTGPVAGAYTGTASPVLFVGTFGHTSTATGQGNNPFQVQGPFPSLAILENGSWRRVVGNLLPAGTAFTDIAAVSPTEVYVGHRQGLFRYDGASISRVTAVTDTVLSVGTTPSGVTKLVILGSTNAVLIGNGTTFTRYTTPINQRWDGVCITGPNEAFASSTSVGGGLIRFDGTNWTSVPAPAQAAKLDLQCTGPGQAFVIANAVGIYRWNGSGWTQMPGLPVFNIRRVRIAAVGPNEIYAAGDSALVDRAFYKFDGSGWTEIGRQRLTFSSGRPWADPRGGQAFFSGSQYGVIHRVTPTSASLVSYLPSLRDVWVNSPTSAFVVGNARFIGRWDGAKWTVDNPPPNRRTLLALNGVWSDGPTRAWAVGQQATIMHWNGNNWTVVTDSIAPGGPLGEYFGVWGSGSTAWAVGDQGVSQCTIAVGCTLTQGLGGPLYGVWGSAANNIWAVGASGRILRYNGTSWTSVSSPTTRKLVKVSGSSPSNIWAVGDSVLLRFDGATWVDVPMTGNLIDDRTAVPTALFGQPSIGLFVRSPTEVYLGTGSGHIARWNGFDWDGMSDTPFVRRIVAISMGTGGCGLAVTESESFPPVHTPTLWRGVGPSGCFLNPMTPPTVWP